MPSFHVQIVWCRMFGNAAGREEFMRVYCVIWFLWRVTKVIKANIVSTFWPRNEYIFLFHSVLWKYIPTSGSKVVRMLASQSHHILSHYRITCIDSFVSLFIGTFCFSQSVLKFFSCTKFCGSIRWIRP